MLLSSPRRSRFRPPVECSNWSLSAALLAMCFTVAGPSPVAAQQTASGSEVSALIEQLGDDSYAMRVRAKEKLQQLGLEAFDELQAAQFHPDSEVVSSVRFLINSYTVSWSKESDPAEVRSALFEYGAQDIDERGSRIQRIATLPDRQGLEALVRLTRFEKELKLSRQAALALMQQPMPTQASQCRQQADLIKSVLKDSDRQAAQWLRVYAEDLQTQSYSVEPWRQLVKKQRREVDANISPQTNRDAVLNLVRTCARRAADLGERDEAIKLAEENIDLISPTTSDLVNACNWATDNKLHEIVLTLQKVNARMFSKSARLIYGTAEAWRVGGNDAKAKELAAQAIAIRPFPQDEKEKDDLSASELEEIAQAHLLLAEELKGRGLFDWAEDEYRCILDGVEMTSATGASTRLELSEMLGEQLRRQAAIDALDPLVDRIRKDSILKSQLLGRRINVPYIESQYEFHRAMLAKDAGDADAVRRRLTRAYEINSRNVDVLIAMYRADGDQDWQETVKRLVANRVRIVDSYIKSTENILRRFPQQVELKSDLSQFLNEYAWLVSNTTGDYKKALAASERSLELTPDDAAKIDTLARCHFTLGELDEALAAQTRALELMPHSPPLQRQLQEIKDRIAAEK